MRLLLPLLFGLISSNLFGQNTTLYFEKDGYTLDAQDKTILNQLMVKIRKEDNHNQIAIIGHTDTDASDKYNEKLALNRARSVENYLKKNKINNRLALLSKGEKNTVNSNATEDQKKWNRRVEIILNYNPFGATGRQFSNHFHQYYEEAPQIFTINPNEGDTLITRQGIEVTIAPRSFKTNKFATPINIHIREFTNKDHFIKSGLMTMTTDNRLLESRGMVNISALQEGDSVHLKESASVGIFFPDRRINDSTVLFQGTGANNEDVLWGKMQELPSRAVISPGQTGGETNWYEEGPYVRRMRWRLEEVDSLVYKISRTEIKNKITFDSLLITKEELKRILTFRSPNLGWINCDRFRNFQGPKENVIVKYNGKLEPTIYLVFDDLNSVMRYTTRENNTFTFYNIPIDSKLTLLGVHREKEEGEFYFDSKKLLSTHDRDTELQLKKVTKEELEEKIKAL